MSSSEQIGDRIDFEIEYVQRVSFAHQQNAIPVIRRIRLLNNTAKDLRDVRCLLRLSPAWGQDLVESIELIPAGGEYVLSDLPLQLNFDYLSTLSERVRGAIEVNITGRFAEKEQTGQLLTRTHPVDVFAYDEWTGLEGFPEIIAAFVTPNTNFVEELLSRTADLLGERTESSSIDGYQSKSKQRVFQMLGCIFEAVRERKLRYSNPPASFERTGQRVRFGEQIKRSSLATCLDLALLICGVMEAAGLRPILLMHKGHAYVGCWLIEDSFQDPACDDLQSIRKRVDLEEIEVFETTLVCLGNHCDFMEATLAARAHLKLDQVFEYAVGIYRSRACGIRPLPIHRGELGIDVQPVQGDGGKDFSPIHGPGREKVFGPNRDEEIDKVTPAGRVEHWKQQLLDLTLRNRLLNFKEGKQTVQLICPDFEHLEDELSDNRVFKVLEQTKLMTGLDPRSPTLQSRQFADNPVQKHLHEELVAKRLRTPLSESENSKRLLELFRRSRAEMEESGSNSLYLALGFLEWKEVVTSDRSHLAPILLIPVKLERKSIHHGFSIQRIDEDAQINVTLLELLRRDFKLEIPGVNPPPEDERGVDVGKVMMLFRRAVKEMAGWEVHPDIWLAQFSFNKFLLWKDLCSRMESLKRNPVVEHLINHPGEPFIDTIEGIKPEALDDRVPYDQIYCPISADSSQLAAIVAAAKGKNFVMHGPPGTGKSQTITNLIAHCLAIGKRVLFVAEKRAALEVVHKRLSQIGLKPFCLELHSSKAGKVEVLRQFGEALDLSEVNSPTEWNYIADRLGQTRAELNEYVRTLHTPLPNGLSAYHCLSYLITHPQGETQFKEVGPLKISSIELQTREVLDNLLLLCGQLQSRGNPRRLNREAKAGLQFFHFSDMTPEGEENLLACAANLSQRVQDFQVAFEPIKEFLGLAKLQDDKTKYTDVLALAKLLKGSPTLPKAFVQAEGMEAFRERMAKGIACGRERDQQREALAHFDLNGLLALDLQLLEERFQRLSDKPSLIRRFQKWILLRPFRKARCPSAPKWLAQEVPEMFTNALGLIENQKAIDEISPIANERLGSHWEDGEAEWDRIQSLLDLGEQISAGIARIAGTDPDELIALRAAIGKIVVVAEDILSEGKSMAEAIQLALDAWMKLQTQEEEFLRLGEIEMSSASMESAYLGRLEMLVANLRRFQPQLQDWANWQEAYQRARAAELTPLLTALEAETLLLEDLQTAFERRYRENVLERMVTRHKCLRHFWGDDHQGRIASFRQLDDQYAKLTAAAVVARLTAELPRARQENAPRNSELGLLHRERAKRARHLAVRKLLTSIPNIAQRLKPCFLMSPLSVAQYLDVMQDNFDIVVFDEASQIPIWDAIGAIARGKQVIIVGDPKQLPPTNFFNRSEDDDLAIDEGSIQDLESILDECLGSGLSIYHLKWHYRSRQEGLIAFSNHHYYENGLYTFPSPRAKSAGVELLQVPHGYYDKGKSRTNMAEAEAITAEVIRRLKDPSLSRFSIGIVTFSQAQQTLVLDKLDEARRHHPEIERFFTDEIEEPVFVKNLENVQGDERDVIIFSICYGPDQAGKISMNFGPLNRLGGERRLNVAVTRAKHQILVFSTLKSAQIDLSRTRAIGAAHLKAYLEYAEKGPRSLIASATGASADEFESIFEKEVAAFIARKGYGAHTQVGCSGYRIDLGVVDPDEPGRYILGIECDGATYHRAATARDRDRLRQTVLEGLGWKIHRIWSTDWWRNRKEAEASLLTAIEMARSEPHSSPDTEGDHTTAAGDPPNMGLPNNPPTQSPRVGQKSRALPYPHVTPQLQSTQELFYDATSSKLIRDQISRIIAQEGPITRTVLYRRVCDEWNFNRVGNKIRLIVDSNMPTTGDKNEQGMESVFWPPDVDSNRYSSYRIPTLQPQSQRSIEEIPSKELKNALMDILEAHVSFPVEDLKRECAKVFGILRLSKNTDAVLRIALDAMIEEKLVSIRDGAVMLSF